MEAWAEIRRLYRAEGMPIRVIARMRPWRCSNLRDSAWIRWRTGRRSTNSSEYTADYNIGVNADPKFANSSLFLLPDEPCHERGSRPPSRARRGPYGSESDAARARSAIARKVPVGLPLSRRRTIPPMASALVAGERAVTFVTYSL